MTLSGSASLRSEQVVEFGWNDARRHAQRAFRDLGLIVGVEVEQGVHVETAVLLGGAQGVVSVDFKKYYWTNKARWSRGRDQPDRTRRSTLGERRHRLLSRRPAD